MFDYLFIILILKCIINLSMKKVKKDKYNIQLNQVILIFINNLGFPERKARIGVERFGYTISLEDLINRLLDMSDDSSKKSNNNNKISLI